MKSNLSKKLGLRIKELRVASGMKQCELADRLNMERSNLTRIESGKQRPTDENLEKIANILQIPLSEFFEVSHIKTKYELIETISSMLIDYSESELQFFYKFMINYKQIKK